MADCPACEGTAIQQCECFRCRAPEGRATGSMKRAHRDRPCAMCKGAGEVKRESAA